MECFELEGTFRGHLVQPPAVSRDIFNWVSLIGAPSNLALNVSRDGAVHERLKGLVPVTELFQTGFWNKCMWIPVLFPRPKPSLTATGQMESGCIRLSGSKIESAFCACGAGGLPPFLG